MKRASIVAVGITAALALAGAATAATVTVNGTAALNGSNFGMQVTFTGDTVVAYVQDNSPASEGEYYVSFRINTNNVGLAPGQSNTVLVARGPGSADDPLRLTLVKTAEVTPRYILRAFAGQETGNYRFIGGTVVPANANGIPVGAAFKRGSAPGSGNGFLKLYKNNTQVASDTTLSNNNQFVDDVRFGAPQLVDASTTGSYYLDDFVSTRTTQWP